MSRENLLVLFLIGFLSSFAASQDVTKYSPCTEHFQNFIITDWSGKTLDDETGVFDFTLSTDFNSYSSTCHGTTDGTWRSCDLNQPLHNLYFQTYPGYTIYINHTYQCYRGPDSPAYDAVALVKSTGNGRIDLGSLEIDGERRTVLQHDNSTITAYMTVAHNKPNPQCDEASRHDLYWDVIDFEYGVTASSGGLFGLPSTTAWVFFNLLNSANGYRIYCQGPQSVLSAPVDSVIIDPNQEWPCPIYYNDNLFPPEAYPRTSYKFDSGRKMLSIEQSWECEDDGEVSEFVATGTVTLPLNCTITLRGDIGNPYPAMLSCGDVNATVKAELAPTGFS
ncbi:hypothetical protein HD806DRAFT_352370 [Xylariaceae sp. AK1471]|nr:hypothetical protein HD806DRAFT_352370 [Xylariaceae sp. AK1471]